MKIFVSYSRRDAGDFAELIQRYFERSKYDVFTAVNNIQVGDVWSTDIESNISKCDIFVIIVTYGALQSVHVENEILQVQREKKKIIPCFHRDVRRDDIKWGLEKIQGIEFTDKYGLARSLYSKIVSSENIAMPNAITSSIKTEIRRRAASSRSPISETNYSNDKQHSYNENASVFAKPKSKWGGVFSRIRRQKNKEVLKGEDITKGEDEYEKKYEVSLEPTLPPKAEELPPTATAPIPNRSIHAVNRVCTGCGFQLTTGSGKFCPNCGYIMNKGTGAAPSERNAIKIENTGGDVFGIGVSGSGNVIGKNVGVRPGTININENQLQRIPNEFANILKEFSENINQQINGKRISEESQ